jgi:hypothetical protein
MNVFVLGAKLNENRNELYVHLDGERGHKNIFIIDLVTYEEKLFLKVKSRSLEKKELYFDQKHEKWEFLDRDFPKVFRVIDRATGRIQNTTKLTTGNRYRSYDNFLLKDESHGFLYWNMLYFDNDFKRKALMRKFIVNYEDLEKSYSLNLDDRFKLDWNDDECILVEDNVIYFRGYKKRNIFGFDVDTGRLVFETKVPNDLWVVRDYFIPKTKFHSLNQN